MPFTDPGAVVVPDAHTGLTEAHVYAAIADVLDPELDEPLVKLGFIDRVRVDGPDITVVFKLPTYWCAPNFAYLMAADLRASIRALPGVRTTRVVLLDHFAEDEINTGINCGQSFGEAFAGEVPEDENLEELRRTFLRKGFLMRQERLMRQMLKAGLDEATILTLRLSDLIADELANIAFIVTTAGAVRLEGAGRNAGAYVRKRQTLGLPQEQDALLITDDTGQPVAPGGLQDFLRRSRSVRMNIMFNTSMCKGLFRTRYENAGANEAHRDDEGDIV
ncbi:MAG TPA: iron-sulfur cluster assembly protein [Ktedonobacteraceae bacterium]|nr:iron-sulfur cluster assembly protein [Ktedonobacteraceae bacterium]